MGEQEQMAPLRQMPQRFDGTSTTAEDDAVEKQRQEQQEFVSGSSAVARDGPTGMSFVMHIKRALQSKQGIPVCHYAPR